MSENSTRTVLNKLVKKGYLTVNTGKMPYIYRLQQCNIRPNGVKISLQTV